MSDLMLRLGALVDELKRRGVLRVGVVYLVGAWLVIQVSDITFPRLGMPDWTVTFVIILGALLFPVLIGVAWAFDFTRRGFERTAPRDTHLLNDGVIAPAIVRRPHGTVAAAALLAIPLIAFGLWYVNDARGYSLDAGLVVITPFRVAGAAPEAHYLREGLMDLIAARIGGAGGDMKVVAPRTVSRTLREQLGSLDADPDQREALALARELGAGRLLEGEVVGGGQRLTVTAALYDVFTGDRIGAPASIQTHPDSLHGLVDQLAARLVAAGSGVSGDQLAHLTTSSIPALRAFLDGERAFRRGQHVAALRAYDHAVSLDTTFALAALGLLRAQGWTPGAPAQNSWERAEQIVQRGLDRLSEADRVYYNAFNGGGGDRSLSQLVTIRLRAAEHAPDAAELHYLAGDGLFHWGEAVGMEDRLERARALFAETIALDSAYVEPLIHLHDISVGLGDTAGTRRWGELLLAIDSTSAIAAAVRFARAQGYAGLDYATERIDIDTLGNLVLARLTSIGLSVPPDERVVATLLRRFQSPTMPDEAANMARVIQRVGMRAGRPSLRSLGALHQQGYTQWDDLDRLVIAIYWLRDPDAVRSGAAEMREELARVRARDQNSGGVVVRECMLGHAALAEGDMASAARAASMLDTLPSPDPDGPSRDQHVCALFLHTAVAVHRRARDALRRLELFDDTLRAGIPDDPYTNQVYQLAIARLWERAGRPERALAAVERRIYLPLASHWHTEMWGEEARLAEQLGRRAEAIDAYQRYLAFREHAEPPFRERADRARERLAALVEER